MDSNKFYIEMTYSKSSASSIVVPSFFDTLSEWCTVFRSYQWVAWTATTVM